MRTTLTRAGAQEETRAAPTSPVAKILLFVLMAILAYAFIFPLLWMLFTSLKPESGVVRYPPKLLPDVWTVASYFNIWQRIPFARFFANTLVFAGSVTLLSLFFDSMTAYALSRLNFPGRDVIFIAVLVALMLPFQVAFVPLYVIVYQFGLLNTFAGLIIPRASNAFGIFMLRSFFVTLPRDLEDAARIDGAGEFYIYSRIILPLSGTALGTLAIFHFMYNWNDFLWPLLITSSPDMRTIPAGLALFMGQHVVEYSVLMAGSVLSLLPLFIAFLFVQRYFVQSIAMTGLKG
jgi:multiple sugar transport system permease protein